MFFLLHSVRCYKAKICAVLFPLRCAIAWYYFLQKSKFSESGQKPWTIIRRFDRNRAHSLSTCYKAEICAVLFPLLDLSSQYTHSLPLSSPHPPHTLTPSHSDPIKLTEGLETADFWVPLGGKSKHAHWSPHPLLAPPIPTLYQCSWETEPRCLAIRRLDGIARGNLQHDYCYVISHQQQVSKCVYVHLVLFFDILSAAFYLARTELEVSVSKRSDWFVHLTLSLLEGGGAVCSHAGCRGKRGTYLLEVVQHASELKGS